MASLHEIEAYNAEQASRCRKLFAAVVFATIGEALDENRKRPGYGTKWIERWARSRDGREVLSSAGIEPSERVFRRLVEHVESGATECELMAAE